MSDRIKAIALVSGGLDSMLALRLIVDQGIAVKAIQFWTPFFAKPPKNALNNGRKTTNEDALSDVLRYSKRLGCDVDVVDLSDDYLQVLHNPRFGYGRNVNPCIDCHLLMFRTACRMMEDEDAHFVFTGEVLGQRPKSQMMRELKLIARQSGLEDRILRPLSARLLPLTMPEREGWVDRSRLLNLQGRTRKPQLALAEQFGMTEIPTPAGGCILTDPGYARKVKDLWRNTDKDSLTWNDYNLLRAGRHLRLKHNLKVIVGRHEEDNELLDKFSDGRIKVEPAEVAGPLTLIDGISDPEAEVLAAGICIRYSKLRDADRKVAVRIENGKDVRIIEVEPASRKEVEDWLIR